MYNPGIGRWMEEDPERIEAGDTNFDRYAFNDPTNLTDPSGLEPKNEIVDWGRPVTGVLPNGGLVGEKGGPIQGKIQVFMGVKWRRIDPELRDIVLKMTTGQRAAAGLTREKLKIILEGEDRESSIGIKFEGAKASEVQVVQFFWAETEATAKGYRPAKLGGEIDTTAGVVTLSTPKTGILWHVDTSPKAKNPIYTFTTIRTRNSITLLDTPDFTPGFARVVKHLEDNWKGLTLEKIEKNSHWETYFIYGGRPFYKVSWEGRAIWERDRPITKTKLKLLGGKEFPDLEQGQQTVVNTRWRSQKVLLTTRPAPGLVTIDPE
jgi:hypothetical protein